MQRLMRRKQEGFTLIEVLLVIAIIAILAAIVIIAINPAKQLRDARNTQRSSDVNTILNAISQYSVDNNGTLAGPGTIPTIAGAQTCQADGGTICATGSASCTGLVDMSNLTANGKYIVSVPKDPQGGSATSAGYNVAQDANGRVTVCAPSAEGGSTISVTR